MAAGPSSIVVPRPAATVVLLRSGADGLEVLLTQRPSSMAFAADMHVFPGGAVDPGDMDPRLAASSALSGEDAARRLGGGIEPGHALAAHVAALRELFEEAGLILGDPASGRVLRPADLAAARRALLDGQVSIADVLTDLGVILRPDLLAPLSHWTTPPIMPRRFDTRFFAAELPGGAEVTFDEAEVVGHRWLTARAALDAMADGSISMWVPTSTTLQQLEYVASFGEIAARLAPRVISPPRTIDVGSAVVRIVGSSAGAVPGQAINTYLVGRRQLVVVDPGDPSDAAAAAILAITPDRGARIAAIALTHVDPDHAAGGEALALRLGIPVFVHPAGQRDLPYDTEPLRDGQRLGVGDVGLTVIATPGPRSDHVAFLVEPGDDLISGDLVGPRADRAILGPSDTAAWQMSLDRLARIDATRLLPGHGDPVPARPAVNEATTRRGSEGS